MDDPYAMYDAPTDGDFANEARHSTASIPPIQSNSVETVKRTHFILDLIFGFICGLLLLYSINVFTIAVVRVSLFNKYTVPVFGPRRNWDKSVKSIVAGTRFVAASGIIGSFFSCSCAVLGMIATVLRPVKYKMIRMGLTLVFIGLMLFLLPADALSCVVAASVNFQYGTRTSYATGVGWLLLGGQFLLIFHCGIIAFAILRIVYALRH